jgi:anthranilate phosphoribosyltransferase
MFSLDFRMIDPLVAQVAAGVSLSSEDMSSAVDSIMRGEWTEPQIEHFLLALKAKGETADEIAGAAFAMRRHMTPIRHSRSKLIDTCGTGGSGSDKFNISTAAALVTAAAGVPVAKHGNRAASSRSGSADVLAELGVNVQAPVAVVERCLEELGICFCFAPLMHAAMKHVMPVRRKLGVPTIFNLLGPLCNPASAPWQMVGVPRDELRPLLAGALARLGAVRAVVAWGSDGVDEATLGGPTLVTEVVGGELRQHRWHPEDAGLQTASLEGLRVDGPAASARMIRQVFAGEKGAARDIVLLNTAAALWVAGEVESLRDGALLAARTIDRGAPRDLLAELAKMSHEPV